jgi:hypothetical protein
MINPRNNGRYTKGKIALIALAGLLQRPLQGLKSSKNKGKSLF